jgi:hypothetical protein
MGGNLLRTSVRALLGLAVLAVAGTGDASPTYIMLPFWTGSVNISVGESVRTTCTGDVDVISACAGTTCRELSSYACVPFTCAADGEGCTATCNSTKDCGQGAACNTVRHECYSYFSACYDTWTVVSPGGQLSSCMPYRCVGGYCQQQCSMDHPNDCGAGFKCARDPGGSYHCKGG